MSKYSSYKEHQLITENWRRFLAEEGAPDDPRATAEKVLSTMSPEEIIMQAAQLPPEVQKQIETAAETVAPQLAQQSSMTNEADEIDPLSPRAREMRDALKVGALGGAGVGVSLAGLAGALMDWGSSGGASQTAGGPRVGGGLLDPVIGHATDLVPYFDNLDMLMAAGAGTLSGVALAAALILGLHYTGLGFQDQDDEEQEEITP